MEYSLNIAQADRALEALRRDCRVYYPVKEVVMPIQQTLFYYTENIRNFIMSVCAVS